MSNELIAAVEKRSLKGIQAALGAGAKLEARDEDGLTPLANLCKSGSGVMSKTEITAALLDPEGQTALARAKELEQDKIIKLLEAKK